MTAPLAESLFMISVMLLLVSFSFAPPYPCRFSHVKTDTLDTKKQSTLYRTSVSYIFSTP